MRKLRLIPPVFLILGLIGAALRRVELRTVFEPVTGLARRGAPVSVALLLLSAGAFAVALALAVALSRRLEAPEGFKRAYYTGSYGAFAVKALLGFTLAVCAVLLAVTRAKFLELSGVARWIFLLFLVLAGLGMAAMAYHSYTLKETPLLQPGSLMPSVLYCYWMVSIYRVNAGNPVLLEYSYSCLAFAAAAVSAYYTAGYAFGRKNLIGAMSMSFAASYLLPIAAVSPAPLALRAAMLATAVYITVNTVQLLGSLKVKEAQGAKEEL